MKKLRKLKLRSYQEMNDSQMKSIVGGGSTNTCRGEAINGSCSGVCPTKPVWNNGTITQVKQTCVRFSGPSYIYSFCDCV